MTHLADPPAVPRDDASPSDAPAFASTLGQTPHEPTVRPWELELLISGATVFALLQLPEAIDAWSERLRPQLAGTTYTVHLYLYIYLKVIVYTLVGSFLLHLSVRAYWVGMIGLESVFPRGVNWENTPAGPVGNAVQRERLPSLQRLIDRSDRFASVIFGVAFVMVIFFVLPVVYGALALALAFVLSRLLFGGERLGELIPVIFVLLFLPGLAAGLVDRWFGKRLEPRGRTWRGLRRALVASHYLQAAWLFGTPMLTMFTNFRRWLVYPLFFGLMYGLIGFMFVKDVLIARGEVTADGYRYLPQAQGRYGVGRGYYEDRRDPGEVYTLPSIQSDVVRDSYVRLFVPYVPNRHNALFAARCPEVRPFSEAGVRMADDDGERETDASREAVLACWARVQPVTLNGKPLEAPFRFATHPRTGLRGAIVHIPTAGLPRGENVLTVADVPPRAETEGKERPRERPPHYIPLWL